MLFEKFLGSVKNKSKFDQDIAMLKDGMYEIIPFKPTRTNLQNRYLWWWVYWTICKESGDSDSDYFHKFFWGMFLYNYRGKKHKHIKSTSKLDTVEFAEYVEKIRSFMYHRMNVYIPTPEERKRTHRRRGSLMGGCYQSLHR